MSTEPPTPRDSPPPLSLPAGTRLGDFELRGVVGAGGFGIVYDAWDHELSRRVAIKEFMPAMLAGRAANGSVSVVSKAQAPTFDYGLKSFINEARLLAGLDHPSLVKVYQFWKANGTAYFVMPFYDGQTLSEVRRLQPGKVNEALLRTVLDGVLGALEALHGQHIVHRDIAPDNILLTTQGRPVLLDFGSARLAIAGKTQHLTAVVKQGYAPMEQYDFSGTELQGPWTDFYALGGTLRFLITGVKPQPSQIRALRDELPPLAPAGVLGVSTEYLRVVDWLLALRPEHRPRNAQQVRDALSGAVPPPQAVDVELPTLSKAVLAVPTGPATATLTEDDPVYAAIAADRASDRTTHPPTGTADGARAANRWAPAAALLAVVATAAAGGLWWWQGQQRAAAPAAVATAASAPAVAASASPVAASVAVAAAASEPVAPPATSASAPAAPTTTTAIAAPAGASAPPVAATTPAAATTTPPAAQQPRPKPPPERPPAAPATPAPTVATDTSPKLSPDMAAALERAQAAQRAAAQAAIAERMRGGGEPATPAGEAASGAAASSGGHSSPLTQCRRDYPGISLRACLASVCLAPEHRFHPVCVRAHREMAEQQRQTGR